MYDTLTTDTNFNIHFPGMQLTGLRLESNPRFC